MRPLNSIKHIFYYLVLIASIATVVGCDMERESRRPINFSQGSNLTPEFNAEGGSEKYFFTSKHSWNVEVMDEWVHVSPNVGSATDNSFTLSVDSHDGGEMRKSHIIMHLSNGYDIEIPITQAMCERYDTEPTDAYVVDAEGGVLDIEISTNLEYKIHIPLGATWIKHTETRSMYSETIHLEIEANTSTKSRIAYITARDVRYDNPVLHRFNVVQSAHDKAPNEIVYTTNTNDRIELNTTEGFGAPFALHLFDGHKGRIIFSDAINAVPERAFDGCNSLTSIEIPVQVSHIGSRAFSGCTACEKFTLPASVTSMDGSIFDGCHGELTINCVVPNEEYTIDANNTITVDEGHWSYGAAFERVIVNNGLGIAAFANSTSLKEIIFCEGCKSIGARAFEGCNNVERVVAKDITTWCGMSFANATANPLHAQNSTLIIDEQIVTTLDTPEWIHTINRYAFYGYQRLNDVRINDHVQIIGQGAFGNCTLESLYLGQGIQTVGAHAFNGCKCEALTINFNTPNFDSNTKSPSHWFHGLKANHAVFGSNVTDIGRMALASLDVVKLEINDSVIHIGDRAFANCSNLEEVELSNNITTISRESFFECHSLKAINLPIGIERIENYAFMGTALRSITIPANVRYVGEYCFHNCTNLSEVYCTPTTPPTLGNEYTFPHKVITFYIPAESLQLYTEAAQWRRYQAEFVGYNFY